MFGGSRLQLSGSLGACGCQAFFGVTADGGKSACGFCLGGCQFFGCFFTGQGAALQASSRSSSILDWSSLISALSFVIASSV